MFTSLQRLSETTTEMSVLWWKLGRLENNWNVLNGNPKLRPRRCAWRLTLRRRLMVRNLARLTFQSALFRLHGWACSWFAQTAALWIYMREGGDTVWWMYVLYVWKNWPTMEVMLRTFAWGLYLNHAVVHYKKDLVTISYYCLSLLQTHAEWTLPFFPILS